MSMARQELAKIHIAKKQLGMDDATYRSMLQSVAGVTSSRDLTPLKRAKVLERLKQLGFKPVAKDKGTKPSVGESRSRLMDKLEALLAHAKLPWSYVTQPGTLAKQSMLERITGKQRLEFCSADDLRKIVAALSYHTQRKSRG